jgi:hypothetical protein
MVGDLNRAISTALSALPTRDEIRRRIAENLRERQLLRRVLKLVDHREQAAALSKEGTSRA